MARSSKSYTIVINEYQRELMHTIMKAGIEELELDLANQPGNEDSLVPTKNAWEEAFDIATIFSVMQNDEDAKIFELNL